MLIRIENYLSGSYRLTSEPKQWDALVVLDSGLSESRFVTQHARRSLQVRFDDVLKAKRNKIEPNVQLVECAIKFGLSAEKLLICCRAGQSRSAALAFAIAFENGDQTAAFDLLNPRRHSPNPRVIEIANELVRRPGLLNAFDQWIAAKGDKRLTDYLDEIETEYDRLLALGAKDRISNDESVSDGTENV